MKALVLTAPESLRLDDVPSRPLEPFDVRVQVACTAVCGSDLAFFRKPRHFPQILGHELAGTVIESGAEIVSRFAPGTRVTASAVVGCLQCETCLLGEIRLCPRRKILGFQMPGAFAEEVVIDGRFAVSLPTGMTFEQGTLIEPLACGYRLAFRVAAHLGSRDSAHIALLGDGPIALADLLMLKRFGFHEITLVGKHAVRMDLASSFGATRVLSCQEPSLRQALAMLSPVDLCVVAADADMTLLEIVSCMRSRGVVFTQTRITQSAVISQIVTPEISVVGAFAYEIEDLEATIRWVNAGEIETDSLITDSLSFSEAEHGFGELLDKTGRVKTLLRPG